MAVISAGSTASASGGHGASGAPSSKLGSPAPTSGLTPDIADGKTQAASLANAGMPVYVPKLIPAGSAYEGPTAGEYPRAYRIASPQRQRFTAYRIVGAVNSTLGQYYGIQGTTWREAPLLASPSEIREVAGRRLELHFDGHKLRLVAWRTVGGVYWISNTLSLNLSNQQMLGLAASLSPG
jgi:hypothetical protein